MGAILGGWFGQLAATAGVFLTLAGIFGVGFRVGSRERQRDIEKDLAQTTELLVASRSEVEAFRAQALLWENRAKEAAHRPLSDADRKLEVVRELVSDGRSLWLHKPKKVSAPKSLADGGRPIITIGNLKGGVGKTTFAVHLAAALARDHKVLLLDLDYQGSASTLLLRAAGRDDIAVDDDRSRASALVQRFTDAAFARRLPIPLGNYAPNLSVVPAYYPLADVEEALMLRWAIGDEPDDIRYYLSEALQSDAFDHDVVIIDAPPRLTTAMAQSIAASTHVLVPTQLERKSTEAAIYFAATVRQFISQGVNPEIELLGVVPNMVAQRTGYKPPEQSEIRYLRESLAPLFPGERVVWEDVPIHDKVSFRRPNLVFFDNERGGQEASEAMNLLALEVARSIGLESRRTGS